MAKKGLGRGLGHLLDENKKLSEMSEQEKSALIEYILVDDIKPNPFQPRKVFEEKALNELTNSIKEHGIFQPILVRKSILGYEIISGERRLRAAKKANLTNVPCIVYSYDDTQMMEVALVENIQREDLSVVEEARSYKLVMSRLNLTQEQLSIRIGKSRTYIANIVRVLKLDDDILDLLDAKDITLGHVKVLISIEDKTLVKEIVNLIITENLSVREVEKMVNIYKGDKTKKIKTPTKQLRTNKRLENILREKLDTKVKIVGNDKGTIEISYQSVEDLERLLGVFDLG